MNLATYPLSGPLDGLSLIGARGPDARKFLHGQLSQDVLGLAQDRVALAGFHNPQGRALAILRLVPLDDDGLLLVLPTEITATVIQRLRRFVLRSKLTLEDVTAQWLRLGLAGPDAGAALAAAGLAPPSTAVGALARQPGRLAWRHALAPERFVVLTEASAGLPAGWPAPQAGAALDWQAADVAAGLPQVRTATSEAFVAQMLNLDALDGVSFTKGCYTGQEVIARAHYRGRVKRRLQRFRSLAPPAAPLQPGDSLSLADGRGARVVEAATLADGRVEFLAVAPLAGEPADDDAPTAGSSSAPSTGGSPATPAPGSAAAPPTAGGTTAVALAVESLPLPYALPG